jgi:tetratricopeptide (TPR) repeat protein
MFKSGALISLIHSMSKPEKKAFSLAFTKSVPTPLYLTLYTLASKDKTVTPEVLRTKFLRHHKGASFDTTVKYLYKILLDTMLALRSEQDSYYSLFDKILKARILFEKSLFEECFDLLQKVIASARKLENYYALLMASRLELEYLLSLNFPGIDEKTLLHKQFRINEAIRITQKINQQSALYELLKHRVLHKGNTRSEQQKNELNDLVVSEMSIVASSNVDNFEIQKLHQLFQANYLISVGDYKSALHSFYELNTLLENNKHLWSNPPIYYLLTLEGILDSLRSLRNYDGMVHFIDQLKKLNNPSLNFGANVTCLIFLYEVFPLLDRGNFLASEALMHRYHGELLKKTHLLSLARNAELSLYLALIYFGLRDYSKAQKALSKIIFIGKSYTALPIYRTIRLVNLMILYEKKDFDLIKYETRSIKRDMHVVGKEYKIERNVLSFVNKQNLPASGMKRKLLWEKISVDFEKIRHDVFEQQILRLFDFSAWVESKIKRVSLSETLMSKS